ncbi:hypothetical protein Tco_0995862 [Tanacetum coccineum]
MTRSSTKELFTPFKDLEREFRSSSKQFKILSLDESRSPDFDLFSNQEEYLEEEVIETMAETMEQYMRKTRADYGSGVARPKIEDKDNFELKGQFLKELLICMDITRITRKEPKPGKNEHENGKSTQEPGICQARVNKSQPKSTLVNSCKDKNP